MNEARVILLVDDDENFRSALADNLRDDGYQVLEYRAATEVPPAGLDEVGILVTDYDMPGTDGLAFADNFHAAHPSTPILMVTGYYTYNLEAQTAARGFVHLLRKPVDYNELHTLVRHKLAADGGGHHLQSH